MAEILVVNASPLILLARSGHLNLLRLAAERIVVPTEVLVEIRRRGPGDVTVQSVASNRWLEEVNISAMPPALAAWDLGRGESAVLAWAMATEGSEVVLDDRAARRCAAALGILATGTLGLVLTARRRVAIPAARPVVDALRAAGMYLSQTTADGALRLVGE